MTRRPHPFVEARFEHQLELVRPGGGRVEVPALPAGYTLRSFIGDDAAAYEDLFALAWVDTGTLAHTRAYALPDGFVVVEHDATGELVSSCVAFAPESPERHPSDGSLGWLVTDPGHGGRGLAKVVAATVTNRLVDEAYACPWLGTEDDRLVAISLYLGMGWRPSLYTDGMAARWRAIFGRLGAEFTPEICVPGDL